MRVHPVDGTVGRLVRLRLPRVIARKAVLVPLLVVAASACSGGDPEVVVPPPLPEITGRPTPSAKPTPAALPSAAEQATPQGAAAFVRVFYDAVTASLVSLDSTHVRSLSDPTCGTCMAIARAVDEERASGNRYQGGRITRFVAEGVADGPGKVAVAVVYSSQPLQLKPKVGERARTVPGANNSALEVEVRRVGKGWRVFRITRVQT